MRFTESYAYDAPIDKVWQMLGDEQFVKDRDANLQIPDPTVQTQTSGDRITSSTTGDVPASMIPAAAQRFLKGGASFAIREDWHKVGPKEIRGEFRAEGKGVPAHIAAHVRLVQNAKGMTDATMEGEIKVSIPFIGPKLEKQALAFAPQLIQADGQAAAKWIAANK